MGPSEQAMRPVDSRCPGCGLAIGTSDDVVVVTGRRWHLGCTNAAHASSMRRDTTVTARVRWRECPISHARLIGASLNSQNADAGLAVRPRHNRHLLVRPTEPRSVPVVALDTMVNAVGG